MGLMRDRLQQALRSLMPSGNEFFSLLKQATENAVEGARLLVKLCNDYSNLDEMLKAIDAVEGRGDDLNHAIIRHLNSSFVTPVMLDREDIIRLAEMIDDIVDFQKAVIDHMVLYEIKQPTEHARQMAQLLLECCQGLDEVVEVISTRAGLTEPETIMPFVKRVNELENQADKIKRMAAVALFKGEKDPIEIIKWKDIYRYLEDAVNFCEDAVNLIEGIVLKNV